MFADAPGASSSGAFYTDPDHHPRRLVRHAGLTAADQSRSHSPPPRSFDLVGPVVGTPRRLAADPMHPVHRFQRAVPGQVDGVWLPAHPIGPLQPFVPDCHGMLIPRPPRSAALVRLCSGVCLPGTAVRQRDAVCEHRLAGSSKLASWELRIEVELDSHTPDHRRNGSTKALSSDLGAATAGPPVRDPRGASSTASTRTGRNTTRTAGRTKRWAVRGRPITTPGWRRPAPRRNRRVHIPAIRGPYRSGATGCIYPALHRATFLSPAAPRARRMRHCRAGG